MKNTLESGIDADIIFLGLDYYTRKGIASLMQRIGFPVQIRTSTCGCHPVEST
jgi:hypothetical protein